MSNKTLTFGHDLSGSKTYIGDGVYAEMLYGDVLFLTAEDGIRATDTIVLEAQHWEALYTWYEKQRAARVGGPPCTCLPHEGPYHVQRCPRAKWYAEGAGR